MEAMKNKLVVTSDSSPFESTKLGSIVALWFPVVFTPTIEIELHYKRPPLWIDPSSNIDLDTSFFISFSKQT